MYGAGRVVAASAEADSVADSAVGAADSCDSPASVVRVTLTVAFMLSPVLIASAVLPGMGMEDVDALLAAVGATSVLPVGSASGDGVSVVIREVVVSCVVLVLRHLRTGEMCASLIGCSKVKC